MSNMLSVKHVDKKNRDGRAIDPALRVISYIVVAMFLMIMLSASGIQGLFADNFLKDPRNSRVLYAAERVYRGPIFVRNERVAYSEKRGKSYKRFYAHPELYSAITGYFNNVHGRSGLEKYLNSELSGANPVGLSRMFEGAENGRSVLLTINEKLQKIAWRALEGFRGSAVIIEPSSGKILALVSRPGFDANKLSNDTNVEESYKKLLKDPAKPLINRAASLYHPGSVFKIITMATALETGRYDLDKEVTDSNLLTFPGRRFFIENSGACSGRNKINLEQALAFSCNATFGKIATDLGGELISKMAERFGFGKKITIPIPFQASEYPVTGDSAQLAQSGFGQWEIWATPLQIAMISAAIANNGKLMKPNIVQRVKGPDANTIKEFTPEMLGRVATQETVKKLSKAMESVVEYGTARRGKIRGIQIAGKTGTAEDGTGRNTLWFTGFAPVDRPFLAVSIVLEEQKGDAGTIAVPIAKKLIEEALNER